MAVYLVLAEAGSEAGNELHTKDRLVVVRSEGDGESQFQRLVGVCRKHVAEQATIINQNEGYLEWTSPYYWRVILVRLPSTIVSADADAIVGSQHQQAFLASVDEIIGENIEGYCVQKACGGGNQEGAYENEAGARELWELFVSRDE